MKPGPFVHHAPRTVDEAVAVLAQVGHDGKVLAGGQSLIPVLNMRLASPGHLVDINGVAGLDGVDVDDALGTGRRPRPARGSRAARRGGCRPPPAAPGPAQRRTPGDPQPRHDGRLDRPRRPGRRDARGRRPHRRRRRGGRAGRSPGDRRRRLLRGPPRDDARRTTSSSRRCASAGSRRARARPSSSPPAATATTRSPASPWRWRWRTGSSACGPGLVRLGDPGADGARPRPGPRRAREASARRPRRGRRRSCGRTSTPRPTSTPAPTTGGCSPPSSPAVRSPPRRSRDEGAA